MDPEGRGMLPGTGVYVNRVRLHQRKPTGNRLCPAMAALAQPASKRAGGRGAGKGVGVMMTGMACCSAYGL